MIDEGYIKFQMDWTQCDPLNVIELEELNHWRRRLFDRGLIGHYEDLNIGYGNLSCRLDGSSFLISGTQTGHIDELDGRHFAVVIAVDLQQNHVTCRGPVQASSESMTHAAMYALDSEIKSVVHVHDDQLWSSLRGELPTTDADIGYGTPAMATELQRLYRDTDFKTSGVAVMGGHDAGLVSIGKSIEEASLRILAIARPGCLRQQDPT